MTPQFVKNEKYLIETPMPEYIHKRRTYYHGTSNQQSAESIMKEGIKVNEYEKGRGANLIPVSGRNYITPDLSYAMIYAIGGNMIGSQLPDSFMERNGQYGYVFVIKGNQLGDIQPDEDSIGEVVHHIVRGGWDTEEKFKKSLKYVSSAKQRKFYRNVYKDRPLTSKLNSSTINSLTKNQLIKLNDGESDIYAHAGKKLVKKLDHEYLLKLITHGAHIANNSVLIPNETWKIDKERCQELKKDGSNFFKIAERIQ